MPPAPTTMADVARRAGVHAATVSRALRDDPRITPAQRKKIRRLAEELGYRTNPLVAALMSARRAGRPPAYKATFACLTRYPAELAAKFRRDYGELLDGAAAQALAQGYRVEEFNTHDPALSPRRLTEILLNRNIHGLIIAPLYSVRETIELDWAQFGAVGVGYSLKGVTLPRVAHDHFNGFHLAVRHARAAGRRRPGLVLQRRVHEKVERRWVAAALLDQSDQPARERVPPLLLDSPDAEKFAAWCQRHQPDVILGLDVPLLLTWLRALGRAAPRDVAVVSLDRRSTDRGIAGVRQDYARLGASAVDLLVGLTQRNERGLPATASTLLTEGVWHDGRTLSARRSVSSAP